MTTTVLPSAAAAPKSDAPGFAARVWAALAAQGSRRAAAELRRIASRHLHSDPELARRLLAIANQYPA